MARFCYLSMLITLSPTPFILAYKARGSYSSVLDSCNQPLIYTCHSIAFKDRGRDHQPGNQYIDLSFLKAVGNASGIPLRRVKAPSHLHTDPSRISVGHLLLSNKGLHRIGAHSTIYFILLE